jgi:DNA-binding MarR family transcriptional regulator
LYSIVDFLFLKEEIRLTENKSIFSDNEYTIMTEIVENENVTQRELSKKLGISVSTVNVLINKMIREGHIKMTQVSQKQVFYMLTPIGMMEKAKKTVQYLKIHYRVIYETKEKIKSVLGELVKEHDAIFVLISDDEVGEIIGIALDEFETCHSQAKIIAINKDKHLDYKSFYSPVLVYMIDEKEALKEFAKVDGLTVVNLKERL